MTVDIVHNAGVVARDQAQLRAVFQDHGTRAFVATARQQLIAQGCAETHRMASFAMIFGCGNDRAFLYRIDDSFNRLWSYARHIRQRHDPTRGLARLCNRMRETHTHAVSGIGTFRYCAMRLFEQAPQFITARPYYRRYRQTRGYQIARRAHPDRHAVERMQKFTAAKARSGTGSEKNADNARR